MKNLCTLLIVFAVLSLLGWSKFAYADWGQHGGHHYYRYHDHPHYGVHVAAFYPNEYYPIWVGGARYYYDDGIYYDYNDGNYVVAAPPIGAVVSTIPVDFQQVSVNGVTYFTDNGTYYVHTPNGYQIISPPVQTAAVNAQNSFAINVPNNTGGYATVILKRSGNGYVGPQGEFYAQFPTVAQLRIMYGR